MKWTKENPPSVTKGWKPHEQAKGIAAANAVLELSGDEDVATFACLLAAGKDKAAKMRAGIIRTGFERLADAAHAMTELGIAFAYDGIIIPNDARKEFRNTIDFEAFAPGTWNGMSFSRADIEEIAANFKALDPYHKVPLKFGHNEIQPFTDGQPALGWVVKAWVDENGKLMLRAADVPDIVKRAIETKLYRKVSVELDLGVEHKGKTYRYVLSGVALLGADIPAVSTLADLAHYLDDKPALAASRRTVFSAIQGRNEPEESEMDEKQIQAMIDKAVKPLADQNVELSAKLKESQEQVAKMTREKEEADKAQKAEKVKLARESINQKLEAGVKQSLITPAQREYFIANMGVNDDARVIGLDVDAYIASASGGKKVDLSKDTGKGGTNKDQRVHEDPRLEVERLAKVEVEKEPKISFSQAVRRVLSKNTDLANEYITPA